MYLSAKDQQFTIYIFIPFSFYGLYKKSFFYMYFPWFVLYVHKGWYYVCHFWPNKEYACSFNFVNLSLKMLQDSVKRLL